MKTFLRIVMPIVGGVLLALNISDPLSALELVAAMFCIFYTGLFKGQETAKKQQVLASYFSPHVE